MPVTLYCNQLFQTHRDLYQFLFNCQPQSCDKNATQLISLSLEVDAIDPLVVLHELATPDQLSFYFEKQELLTGSSSNTQRTAIAAVGSAIQFQTEGRDRFTQTKDFIQATLSTAILTGDLNLPFSGPHFFCSFSFSEKPSGQSLGEFAPATIFLPSWQVSYYENCSTVVANLQIDAATCIEAIADQLWQTLQKLRSVRYELLNPIGQSAELLQHSNVASTERFQQSVQSALQAIQSDIFAKIVLAHAVDVVSPFAFHPIHSLNNLRILHPDCYVFSVCNGQGRQFIGASPERLVSLKEGQLVTDALAGSAARGNTACEDARIANMLLHNAKEIHEHQVVIDFITGQLAQLGLKPQRLPLRLLQLSNIQHLHTPIWATVPDSIHLVDILAALHPTPAVAGMPRDITCDYIQRYEPFARSLYAAPIGWVNHKGDGEFAVGIRSAMIEGCKARLFAGAGIVAGSDPDRELAEVQLKLQALLAALV